MWIPVDDRLPEKFWNYLCVLSRTYSYKLSGEEFFNRESFQSIECFDGKRFEMTKHISRDLKVMFWMPLPDMPEWFEIPEAIDTWDGIAF